MRDFELVRLKTGRRPHGEQAVQNGFSKARAWLFVQNTYLLFFYIYISIFQKGAIFMKKQAAFRVVAVMMAVLMFIALVPVAALPEFSSENLSSDAVIDSFGNGETVTEGDIVDGISCGDSAAVSGEAQTDSVAGDTVPDTSDWAVQGGSASAPLQQSVNAASDGLLGASAAGSTPYDPLDVSDENDPFLTGGDAWINRNTIYYGAPATPTYPLTKWASNTSVVNTSFGAFPDVEAVPVYASQTATVTSDVTATGGTAYSRYDAAYGKWGITFDRNVTQAVWYPNATFKPSAQSFLYFSIEQTDGASLALALKITAPDGTSRWYTVTDNQARYTVDKAQNAENNPTLIPDVTVTEAGAADPIVGEEQTVKGAITGCINIDQWIPTLLNYFYGNYNYTLDEVRIVHSGEASRLNYLYFGPSTGYDLMPQANVTNKQLGSNIATNGWESGELVEVIDSWNDGNKIVIDTTDANLSGKTYTEIDGYIQVSIPVRRWYNVMVDARSLSLSIKSDLYSAQTYHDNVGTDEYAPTVSLWGNEYGWLGDGTWKFDPYRYTSEQIIAVLGTGYYLVDAGNKYESMGYQLSTSLETDYTGASNHFDILRASGAYANMLKSANSTVGVTEDMVGWTYISTIRITVRKGDVVTLEGTTLGGNPANINDNGGANGGAGVQPVITAGAINAEKVAAYGPQLATSTYAIHDLLNREDVNIYGIPFTVSNANGWGLTMYKTIDNTASAETYDLVIPHGSQIIVSQTVGSKGDTNTGWWGYTCYNGQYAWVKLCTVSGYETVKQTSTNVHDYQGTSVDRSKWTYSSFVPGSGTAGSGTDSIPRYPADASAINGLWGVNGGLSVDGVTTSKANSTDFGKSTGQGTNAISREVNITLKQTEDTNNDASITKASDAGYPVLYYDFDAGLWSGSFLSIALTIDSGNGQYMAYLTNNGDSSAPLGLYSQWNGLGSAQSARYISNGTHTGYVSLKWFIEDAKQYASDARIVGVSIYSGEGQNNVFRRLEVLTNDAVYDEMINSAQDGASGYPSSGSVDVYDSVDVLGCAEATVDMGNTAAAKLENKGWTMSLAGYSSSYYKYGTGNLSFTMPNNATNSSYLGFHADRSYSTSEYKYLYYSFAMRDPSDGIGYYNRADDVAVGKVIGGVRMYLSGNGVDDDTGAMVLNSSGGLEANGWTYFAAAMGCIDLSRYSSSLKSINRIMFETVNKTGKDAQFYVNYLILSNQEPTELYQQAINKTVIHYIYLMDNTGSQYSARFPTADNITGIVREDSQRVNPLKVERGVNLEDGTFFNGISLNSLDGLSVDAAENAIWFYTRSNSTADDEQYDDILDVYEYKDTDGNDISSIVDMDWSYGRYGSIYDRLYKASETLTAGSLLQKYANENNVLLRAGIVPIMYTTYYDTQGGQMTYVGSAAGTGVAVNENNYYITNTGMFDYFTWPTTAGLVVNPVKTGFLFDGWYTVPNGQTASDSKLWRYTEKDVPGDNHYYAHWSVDPAYASVSYKVSFKKNDASVDDWFTYSANAANEFTIQVPSVIRVQTGDGIVQVIGWKQKLADGTIDDSRVYTPGTKLMISDNVDLVPIVGESADNTVTVTLTGDATLWLVAAEGDYRDPASQNITMTQSGTTRTYTNVPVNVRMAVKPATAISGGVWQLNYDNSVITNADGSSASAMVVSRSKIYEFTAFTDMNLTYTTPTGSSGDANGVLVWSCPIVPVGNRQMDFYAQADMASIEAAGYTFVAAGTLYTKNGGNYESIQSALDANMRLDEATLASGAYSTVTKAVRQITATMTNTAGQYRLSVTENKGNAVTYYTRAYCVYTDGSNYYVAYSNVIASGSVEAAVLNTELT